ncbi:MAG: phosphate ABC transporter permease subunit PstC [Candidatus Poseidoniaceae archaeon]|nr:phosphate ABC transporter permease subunit PstC [Candidatus Poseidoniaceae archaeon]
MSFLQRLTKDKAGTILFVMSLSVILITLGIIQTLLFETIAFFSDIAEHRGWFSFDWDFSGILSASGFACLLLVVALFLDRESKAVKGTLLSSIPLYVWNPHHGIVKFVFSVAILQLLFNDSFLLGISILFCVIVWRSIGKIQMKRILGGNIEISNLWRNILSLFILITVFDAITMNYSGALGEFFFQNQWTPTGACEDRRSLCETMSFGVNSLLLTTLQVAFGALVIAVPLGVGCAIYLSEYAPPRLAAVVKPTLEILAGIPSVVYGFFAFIYIGPLVVEFGEYAFANGWIDQPPNVLNPINGAIVVGIMILPLIASMSEDALRAVPNELREGSLALGATKIETTMKVMIQASLSGIIASIILALSRAVGETMAVTLAVGTVAVYTSNMFVPAQTMTAYIAQRVGGDLPFGEIGYLTIFAVGLYLFAITLCLNLLGNKVLSAYREAY